MGQSPSPLLFVVIAVFLTSIGLTLFTMEVTEWPEPVAAPVTFVLTLLNGTIALAICRHIGSVKPRDELNTNEPS